MAVVREFTLPDLGEGLTGAEIVRWLVQVGDVVAVDQPVVEVETAKAMVDVPCPYGGVVTARYGEEGAEVPVGAPLITVAVPEGSHDGSGPPVTESVIDGASGNVLVGYGTAGPAARRRRVRPSPGPPPEMPTAPGGPLPETAAAPAAPVREATAASAGPVREAVAAPAGPLPVISPLVRRLAREHDVDLRRLRGSGPEGLILRADVERAASGTAAAPVAPGPVAPASVAPAPAAPGPAAPASVSAGLVPEGERVPLRGVRGAVADKLARSRREIPDATCWVDADATELLAARAAMNATGEAKVSVLALLARICTAALARFPELNATVDTAGREIVRLPDVHLGFAAQTDRGLVVPVVRDAHTRTIEGLSEEIARLTEAARTGTLAPAQLTGGTFTLNNYGVFGVDGSTPIINHPEAAMLGVGRIAPKPWVHQGGLAVRQVVQLSFTFDHRVCDGGTAGGFLRFVADCVEQPMVLLRRL
ncbi:dihydrolipoamide acetyltransferase family protein [Streptomyces rapamycinicus]|uniref:Dihydrolipoamide acetyltransferase component of pyruvate dehydrogenase complex n=2 Tax=Streptomyces rapamycinicus TaxID=1226757 RepID=A0A3L8RNB1_STRRN|nr:dihydrolipoamide acetyltransferase family protein [Streptomyces rapamycinicus]MBB4784072.1 pyruvate dehydrogenase E2 component (dihydrolipoamide acetyltransferase) [Streptomyces rapamycinicus]RLV80443.1 branched-chain alpha-keto acid dehydrogenase subunit E2 [Streptomyces rapamycinicus NRRL 5491]UTO64412.1 2-oxo acid dehydrogenase subunit E2 [Streptomyces rapamycinicus]UTP32368.1 2-oxo acid dehydrogenase subunit E2 [Streptomyces rapamycinicus NRRL 5491]